MHQNEVVNVRIGIAFDLLKRVLQLRQTWASSARKKDTAMKMKIFQIAQKLGMSTSKLMTKVLMTRKKLPR
jgi:hypothetical protein